VVLGKARQGPASGAPTLDIDACRRGDRRALSELFCVEAPAVERLISRLLGPGPEVEDLLQCTLIAAVAAFPRYRGEASVRTWLASIAVRVVYAHLRRQSHKVRPSLSLVGSPTEAACGTAGPDRAAESRQLLERLYRHLDAVSPGKRIPFVLHVLEGRPVREVAALVGATETATKSRIFFGRRSLLGRIQRDPELRDLLLACAGEGGACCQEGDQ
jgi:RNA polymerase sigma-70 factor, ECF subfamily